MNLRRIQAILLQEFFVTYRSGEVIADIFVFPFGNIIVFGFLSLYLAGENPLLGKMILLGMLLWQIIWIVQYSLTLGSLWNIWSRNLTNIFIAPIRAREYIVAQTISGIVKSLIVLVIASVLSYFAFNFNLLEVGLVPLLLIFVNFVLFAYAVGLTILGCIFRLGTRIQAAAWASVSFIQPLAAAFYPLSVLPTGLQYVAKLFPATYAYEAARYAFLSGGQVAWGLFGAAFLGNLIYCVAATKLFQYLFAKSLESGQFARNEA